MGKKVRKSITIDEDLWKILPNYINSSRSAFFEKQARRQVNCNDEIEEIDLKLQEITNKKNNLNLEEQNLKEKREHILELREKNKNNFEIKQKAMNIIRTVVNNEGAISETRIKFIAKNHYLEPKVLIEQAITENLKILRK